jgi:hypothetical protein
MLGSYAKNRESVYSYALTLVLCLGVLYFMQCKLAARAIRSLLCVEFEYL